MKVLRYVECISVKYTPRRTASYHLTEQRHQYGRFSGTCGSNDHIDHSALEKEIAFDLQTEVPTAWGWCARLVCSPGEGGIAETDSIGIGRNSQLNRGILAFFGILVQQLGLGSCLWPVHAFISSTHLVEEFSQAIQANFSLDHSVGTP